MRGRYAQRPLPGLHGLSGVAVHSGLPDAVEDNLAAFDADGLIKDSGISGVGGGSGDMTKAVYDVDDDGIVGDADYAATAGDADTVDGSHAAAFATSGHNHTGTYAPAANGVTNGDSHDHSGGDGGQVDHGGLAGLGDDDHSQYILVAGSRAFTGDQAMGTHKISGLAHPTLDGDAARLVDTKSYVTFGKSSALTVGMILSMHSIANSPFVAFRAGSITGLSIQVNSSLTSGYAIAFQVYKNGNPGTLVVQRSDSNGVAYAVQATGVDTFVAGDTLDVRVVAPGGGKSHDVDANGVVAIMEITQAPTS